MAIDPSMMTGSLTPEQIAQWGKAYEAGGEIAKQQIANQYKMTTAQIAGNYKIALLQNGISQQTVEQTREYQRGLLAQAAAEMEKVSIPQVQIQKFVAETNAEIAKGELAVKQGLAQLEQQKFGLSQQQFAEAQQEFVKNFGVQEAGVTGTYNGAPTLAAQGQQFNQGVAAAGLTGFYGGAPTLQGRQQALDEAERQRQYALSVGQLGAQLASTPDRYFQARRFAALDAPRLLGQDTSGVAFNGAPSSSVGQLGAYLTGADPSQGYVPPPTFGSYGAPQPGYGSAAGGANPMADPSFAAGAMQFMRDNGGTLQDAVAWMNSKAPDDSNRVAAIQSGLANGYGGGPGGPSGQSPAPSAYTQPGYGQTNYPGGTQGFSEQGSGYATPYGGPTVPQPVAAARTRAATGAAPATTRGVARARPRLMPAGIAAGSGGHARRRRLALAKAVRRARRDLSDQGDIATHAKHLPKGRKPNPGGRARPTESEWELRFPPERGQPAWLRPKSAGIRLQPLQACTRQQCDGRLGAADATHPVVTGGFGHRRLQLGLRQYGAVRHAVDRPAGRVDHGAAGRAAPAGPPADRAGASAHTSPSADAHAPDPRGAAVLAGQARGLAPGGRRPATAARCARPSRSRSGRTHRRVQRPRCWLRNPSSPPTPAASRCRQRRPG